MNRQITKTVLTFFLFLTSSMVTEAQQKFSVVSFNLDQFDLTARNDQHKKIDGNGSPYAIIKVTSTNPDDKLSEYQFNFGNMNHEVVQKEGQLWVYVQRNAKFVTISRQGYTTIDKYDLGTTIEAGKTYAMKLSTKARAVQTQMIMFIVDPPVERTMITVKSTQKNAVEEVLGMTDESGALARNMPLGTYTYKIASEGYYPTEGSFVLNDKTKTHQEKVTLRPRFAMTSLSVDADADIYVNGQQMGKRTWKGRLNAGSYVVECRQLYHRSTTQTIVVEEGITNTYELTAPSPITGMLSIISQPLGASITIDGKEYGETPQNIDGLLIGQHTVRLSKNGYSDKEATTVITEDDVTELNMTLQKGQMTQSVVVNEAPMKEIKTINGVSENEYLYKKHKRTAKIYNWIAGIGGVGLVGAGVILISVDGTSSATGEADPAIHNASYAMMGGGAVWAGVFFLMANAKQRKAKGFRNLSLWHNDFNFSNGSTLSASIDFLKDDVNRYHTLGLGLQYNF